MQGEDEVEQAAPLTSKVNIEIEKTDKKLKLMSDCYYEKRRDIIIFICVLFLLGLVGYQIYKDNFVVGTKLQENIFEVLQVIILLNIIKTC